MLCSAHVENNVDVTIGAFALDKNKTPAEELGVNSRNTVERGG